MVKEKKLNSEGEEKVTKGSKRVLQLVGWAAGGGGCFSFTSAIILCVCVCVSDELRGWWVW